MKRILNLLLLLFAITCEDQPQTQQQFFSKAQNIPKTQDQQPNDRKLVFAPYANVNQDYSANTVGMETQPAQKYNNPALGPFQDAPVPTFGLGGMMPNSLGLTHQPYNYMYGSPMMHPMNPMNQFNPMSGNPGFMGQSHMMSMHQNPYMSAQNSMNSYSNAAPPLNDQDLNDFNELDNIDFNTSFDSDRKLGQYAAFRDPNDGLISQCRNTQKQAIQISNAIMRRQNKAIYKEIMNYLLKSKYLLAMTEIKLTRVLRKKIYALMNQYSSITEDNIEFIPMKRDYDLKAKNPIADYGETYNSAVEKEIVVGDGEYDENIPGFEGVLGRK